MTIREKAAYLRGLVEGQEMDPEAGEGKLWRVLAEVIGDMAVKLDVLESDQSSLSAAVDVLKDDLEIVEDIVADGYDVDFSDSEEEEPSRPYYPFGKAYSGWDDEADEEAEDEDALSDEEEDEEFEMTYQVECPNCGEEIVFNDETLDAGSIYCPSCGAVLEFELTSLSEEEDAEYDEDDEADQGEEPPVPGED